MDLIASDAGAIWEAFSKRAIKTFNKKSLQQIWMGAIGRLDFKLKMFVVAALARLFFWKKTWRLAPLVNL